QSDNIEPDEAATEDEEESENVTTENESDKIIASSTGEESNEEEFAGLTNFDPKSAKVALAAPEADEWRIAMRKEFDALMKNETWTVVDRPKDRKVIGYRWVLRTKLNVDGLIEPRAESIRLVMALAVEKGLEVHQLDFVSAYLNGEIEEELYMEIPDHLQSILSEAELQRIPQNKVLKLKKALYGLKQSGRQWFTKL
ncbi:retrotransposon ty1-copia subclass, partial [Lasius niger]